MWGDIIDRYQKYEDPKYYIKLFTKLMILLILIRIASIFYLAMVLEVQAGYWGMYSVIFMYPFYVVIIMVCLVYLAREDLQHLRIISLHIFTILFMSFEVLIYILSMNKTWDYWIF